MGLRRLSRVLLVLAGGAVAACQAAPDAARSPRVVSSAPALRPNPGSAVLPPTFDRGDVIETFDTSDGFFRVHFTRAGRHAVPDPDRDRNGVPDYVDQVGHDYSEVLQFYRGLGYRDPLGDGDVAVDNGGDGRFDVYLLDFSTSADGEFRTDACNANGCSGHMLLENDFGGRRYASAESGVRLVSSHEFFHAVQHAYVPDPSSVLGEGTAVWASEAFDRDAGDLERQAPGYLNSPDRSLTTDSGGPVDPYTYGSAVFFEFIEERYERAALRALWERLAASPPRTPWTEQLDQVLQDSYSSSIEAAFGEFAEWLLYTGARADPEHGFAHGDELASVKEREVEASFSDEDVRVFALAARYYALTAEEDAPLMASADAEHEDEIAGLELLVALEHDGKIVELKRESEGMALDARVDAEAGDVLHVALLNTRLEGESLKPDLCIGTVQQVASCRAGNGAADAGVAAADAGPEPAKKSDAGCSVGQMAGAARGTPSWLLTICGLWFARRRSRAASASAPAIKGARPSR